MKQNHKIIHTVFFCVFLASFVLARYPSLALQPADHAEQVNVAHLNGYVVGPYMKLIQQYKASIKKYPNPPAPNLTNIRESRVL